MHINANDWRDNRVMFQTQMLGFINAWRVANGLPLAIVNP